MSDEVILRVEGRVGRITLNRPQALNSLTLGMCQAMIAALLTWRDDPAVQLVLIDHAGPRGFCAGGDVRALVESLKADGRLAREFFFTEYRLDHLLFEYPKPTLVIMDGVVMGGGAGVVLACRFRVATPRTRFAMPEAGIGLFPDVGGGWHLSRMPGHIGLWLAMTGAAIGPADCELVGVATDYLDEIEGFRTAVLAAPERVETLLTEFEAEPGRPALAAHQDEIDRLFGADSVEAILAGLAAAPGPWAAEQLSAIRTKSPQTLKVAFRQLRDGRAMTRFADNMRMEHRIAMRVLDRPDFMEGVRAVIVDKDNSPRWDPPTVEQVDEALIDSIFAPLPSSEEWSPLP